jgi:MFS family permease
MPETATAPPYPPLIKLLIGGTLLVVMARSMSLPFLAIYLHARLGLDPPTIGLVIGSGALIGALTGVLGGYLSDIVGRRQMLVGSLLLAGLCFPFLALGSTVFQFFLINAAINLATACYEPISRAIISDTLPPEQRLKAFARRYVAVNIGFAIGPPLGATIGLVETPLAFVITGAAYLLFGAAIFFHTRRGRPQAPAAEPGEAAQRGSALRAVRTDVRLLLFTLGSVFAVAVHGQMSVTFSQYLVGNWEKGATMFAWLMSVNAVTVVLSQPHLTRWSERREPLTGVVLGAVVLSAGAAGFALSPGMPMLVVSMVVFTLGEVLLVPAEYAIVDSIAPPSMRGAYYGVHSLASVGNLLGPWIGGVILLNRGGPALFYAMAGAALVSMAVFVAGARLGPAPAIRPLAPES